MTIPSTPVPTVREFILQEAQKSYPEPVRAGDLRRRMHEQYGAQVHEKTFGMTLYRLSKEDLPPIQRRGRQDWYFVPEEDRPAAARLRAEIEIMS